MIERQYTGQGTWEEVWFCEVRTGPGRGLWVRYTITSGSGPQGPIQDACVWAMAFTRDGVKADKEVHPLTALAPGGLFRIGEDQQLSASGCEGRVGAISWSLKFEDRGRRHQHLPPLLRKLPIVTRHYAPAILDLRCSGHVEIDGERIEFESEPGVLGHIWGRENSLETWAWGHCNAFDGDVVFEGLSAKLSRPLLRRKALSTFVLITEDHTHYGFSSARQLWRNTATWGGRRWTFRARSGRAILEGEAELPPPATCRVEYTNTDGRPIYCSNSRLSRLRLHLVDPGRGVNREYVSDEAAFEIGRRSAPTEPLHLTGERSRYARI